MEPGLFLLCLWSLWYGRDRAGLSVVEACAGRSPLYEVGYDALDEL